MPSTGAPPETLSRGTGAQRAGFAALGVFVAAVALTVWMAHTMTGGMTMPGGWTMSMAWMPMAGQGWLGATAMFLAMWLAMMVAMMLPSAWPVLALYRRTLHFRGDAGAEARTWLAGTGYFAVWLGFGALAYGVGVALTQAAMHSDAVSRSVPTLAALALVVAGLWQLTPMKTACLAHCRHPIEEVTRHLRGSALRLGLEHGAWCAGCCWGIMLVQLALGVMSLPLMALLAGWIALEKLAPAGPLFARLGGGVAILAGAALLARIIVL